MKPPELFNISNSPLRLKAHEIIHDQIRMHLLREHLPTIFPKLVQTLSKHSCYPVILGGTVVTHCASLNPMSVDFVRDLFSEDIDIKCVIMKPIHNNEDKSVKAIDRIRKAFAKDIMQRATKIVKSKHFESAGWWIEPELSFDLTTINVEHVKRKQVYEVVLHYVNINDRTRKLTLPLVDMSLFSNYSTDHFEQYRTMFPTYNGLPIPTSIHDNILFASCNYAYYDTIRMMIDRAEYFKQNKSMFALLKLSRYIVKFLCLYILLKNKSLKRQVDPQINALYQRTHKTLKIIDLLRYKPNDGGDSVKTLKYNTPYAETMSKVLFKAFKAVRIEQLAKAISHVDSPKQFRGNL